MPRGDSPAKARPKILCVRVDKIGDLISTMPVDEIFPPAQFETAWVISKGLGFIAEEAIPPRRAFELSKESPRADFQQILETYQPDIVIDFYGPWWVSFESWKASVRFRIGRRSRWASFLFLNHGLRQSRSQSEKHEAEYNLDLALLARDQYFQSKSLSAPPAPLEAPILQLQAPDFPELLERYELDPESYIVVHAGMAGSALNWPSAHYKSLIEQILEVPELAMVKVVLTGTAADEPHLKPLRESLPASDRILWLDGKLSTLELLYVLQEAAAVVAPSTGVLHLAASLGTHSIGLYSPVRAQSVKRWGARGRHVTLLTPPVLEREAGPDCMALIPVDEVLAELESGF